MHRLTRLDCYKALDDLWVEIVEDAVINIGLVRLSLSEWAKDGCGTAKYQLKLNRPTECLMGFELKTLRF